MMIPDDLRERVQQMVSETGYVTAAWFCRVGRSSLLRWMHGQAEPLNGSVALLQYGVARWERSRARVSPDTGRRVSV